MCCLFFQAEDGIRDLVRSRGLGDVYKRQVHAGRHAVRVRAFDAAEGRIRHRVRSVAEPGAALSLIHI